MESVWPGRWSELLKNRDKGSVSVGFTRFQNGDVLVPKITPTFEAGRSIMVNGLVGGLGAGTTELHVLRPSSEIDGRFLCYVTQSQEFLKLGEAEMYGVAGQQRVPDGFVRDFPISLVSLDEQRRIADYLDAETARIDDLVRLRTRVRLGLSAREQAQLDLEIDQLSEVYGTIQFRRLIAGVEQGSSPQCDNIEADDDEWGVLKVSAVKGGRFVPGENKRLPDGVQPEKRYEILHGDLLITRANTPKLVGAVAVAENPRRRLMLCDKIFRVKVAPGLDKAFLAMIAQGTKIRDLCALAAHGTSQSMVNLRIDEVKNWPVPAAPLEVQRQAVNRLAPNHIKNVELQQHIDQQLILLAEHRQALITAAVTGEFDVSTAGVQRH